ncbi:MAG TPA: outer membrane protein assembly factor BamD [Verrucomicrobiae bacterium]|jgi:outer membrane protein assembly factor BamD
MSRSFMRVCLLLSLLVALPYRSPAPLIYRPGEGWTYETPGAHGDWHRARAKDQLAVAQQAFDQKKYRLALKASKRVISVWLSDYSPQAQYLIGRCYEELKMDEYAFNAYQTLLDKYPKSTYAVEVQHRQFLIATRFLGGQWFKLFGHIPFFPSMDKTSEMFAKIVRYGPYGDLGPQSQMNIGVAREREKEYPLAVKAYETAADRYTDQPQVAADALYKAAQAYTKQARKAEYDQSVAAQAISAFTDFMALHPDDKRVPEAQKVITSLKAEQARGNFRTAQFYEKLKKWDGALVYYNEVLSRSAGTPLANQARQRIDILKKRMAAK